MRLAVLSDVHGNVRALDAVVADMARRDVEQVVHLGDCLYGPFNPVPVADRLLAADWLTACGNEDRLLVEAADGRPASRTGRFTLQWLNRDQLRWLARLPRTLAIAGRAIAFHGTPVDDTQYLLSRPMADGTIRPATDHEIVQRLGSVDASLFLCGHDHLPCTARLRDGRTAVNPGSVGCSAFSDDLPIPHRVENGTPHARYAIVGWEGDAPDVELVAVPYDWDAAAREAEANGFPEWSRWLRTGHVT